MANPVVTRERLGGLQTPPGQILAVADIADGNGGGVNELEVAFLCEKYKCLPSQVLNEDIVLIRRMNHAQSVFDAVNEEIGKRSPHQWKIIKQIQALRNGQST